MVYTDSFVSYFEKPTTADEKVVAELFEKMATAINQKNLDTFFLLFSPTARISLLPDVQPISVAEYRTEMSRIIPKITRILYKNVVIRTGIDDASVHCVSATRLSGSLLFRIDERQFKFVKRGNTWQIFHVTYFITRNDLRQLKESKYGA